MRTYEDLAILYTPGIAKPYEELRERTFSTIKKAQEADQGLYGKGFYLNSSRLKNLQEGKEINKCVRYRHRRLKIRLKSYS